MQTLTKKAVEAARAANDACRAEAKLSFNEELYADLLNAEKEVATADVKAVETLKITAGSSAVKGAITVKWTVKGDTSAVEGYEIWRSVKKNSWILQVLHYNKDNI